MRIDHLPQIKESSLPVIKVDAETRFQKIDGFGASFNEAGMIMPEFTNPGRLRINVLKSLFDPDFRRRVYIDESHLWRLRFCISRTLVFI